MITYGALHSTLPTLSLFTELRRTLLCVAPSPSKKKPLPPRLLGLPRYRKKETLGNIFLGTLGKEERLVARSILVASTAHPH